MFLFAPHSKTSTTKVGAFCHYVKAQQGNGKNSRTIAGRRKGKKVAASDGGGEKGDSIVINTRDYYMQVVCYISREDLMPAATNNTLIERYHGYLAL